MMWNLAIHLSEDLPMPTVRALVLVRDLEIFGVVENVVPDIRNDQELEPGGTLHIRLSSTHPVSEVEARIQSFEGMTLEIAGFSPGDNIPAAPINSLSTDGLTAPEEYGLEMASSMPSPAKSTMADYITQEMLETFVAESLEHLDNSEMQLLAMETDSTDREALNAVFRAFHTVKGSAGILGLTQIGTLAHQAENLLDRAREGSLILAGPVIDLVFDTVDGLKQVIKGFRADGSMEGQVSGDEVMVPLIERLKGVDTLLTEDATEAGVPTPAEASRKRLGEVLTDAGLLSPNDLAEALQDQSRTVPPRKIGEVLVKEGKVEARQVAKALRSQGAAQSQALQIRETVKVDADRLDQLLDTIGELVIAESMVCQSDELKRTASPALLRHLGQLDKITRELQAMGTSLRMVPIRPTFQKMARLVRDLAHKSWKKVELITAGEDTELDKTVVDQIGDPLIHMIRNAVDHGIETDPKERIKLGKPEVGRIELRAYHKGGAIYIEVHDDGRGLNKDAILAKAIDRGLVREGEPLTEREIFNLIFLPGFSTASTISDVSGRGVGMDVVKKNVEALRGQVEIISEPGMGSVFTIRLPLTLAIIDGMVVRVSGEKYIIPTLSIVQSLRPLPGEISSLFQRGEMLSVQGDLIPLFRLDRLFDTRGALQEVTQATAVVVEDDGKRAALVVDDLLGQQQIVIKPLGEALNGTPGLSGGAIMPDGRVGLILDIGALVRLAVTNGNYAAKDEVHSGSNGFRLDRPEIITSMN